MASDKTLLYYGALLHDIGKVLWREAAASAVEGGSPEEIGAAFLLDGVAAENREYASEDGRAIAEQLRFHQAKELRQAQGLADGSLAYVTCFANSVAMGSSVPGDCDGERAGDLDYDTELRSIFNQLNGHHDDNTIALPPYRDISARLKDGLVRIGISPDELNGLIGLLQETLGVVPTSLNPDSLLDVPLSDHLMTTAAVAVCVYEYLRECGISDYRGALLDHAEEDDPLKADMFLLYSCDMSGIQDFIYNISGSGALKQLRARSMYLELLLEHVADELLERLGLCRANLLYTGGGHAYMLLPNTQATIAVLEAFRAELNAWLVANYRTDLYVASAWVTCSAEDLANRGTDKRCYPQLFQRLTRGLSEAKASRYDAMTIRALNFGSVDGADHSRECSECHRSDLELDKESKCTLCSSLGKISRSLITRDVFVIERDDGRANARSHHPGLPLPFGCTLRMYSRDGYLRLQAEPLRVYAKEGVSLPSYGVTYIWMGDYAAETVDNDISAYATQSATLTKGKDGEWRGIKRLGVLRADVDDLGATFVAGLPDDRVCIARTATLSRAFSRFFKHEINAVLRQGDYQVQIIYSGGDDLFLVGNWSDIIFAAVDIRQALAAYIGNGAVTISGGIGMFDKTYPIARMASETGELEDAAKHYVGGGAYSSKNAVALWTSENVFAWDEFIDVVMPQMHRVQAIFASNEKGTALIYQLVALLRNYDDVASAPRLAYLLARSFENDAEHGGDISRELYELARDTKERRCLLVALEWYVYSIREERS